MRPPEPYEIPLTGWGEHTLKVESKRPVDRDIFIPHITVDGLFVCSITPLSGFFQANVFDPQSMTYHSFWYPYDNHITKDMAVTGFHPILEGGEKDEGL
jgi:hypothetical protein